MKKVLKYLLYLFIIIVLGMLGYALFFYEYKGPDPCLCVVNNNELSRLNVRNWIGKPLEEWEERYQREQAVKVKACLKFYSEKAGRNFSSHLDDYYLPYIKKLCNNPKATFYDPEVSPIDDQQEKAKREQEIKKILEGIQNRNNVKTVPEDELLTDNIYEDETRYDTEQNIDEEIGTETDFYIIAVSVTSDKNEASKMVAELKSQGYNSNFLWIPDYKSLSGAKFYSVYIGPFNDINECANEVEKYRKIKPDAYALLVSNSSEQRVEIRGPGKIRKQELIN